MSSQQQYQESQRPMSQALTPSSSVRIETVWPLYFGVGEVDQNRPQIISSLFQFFIQQQHLYLDQVPIPTTSTCPSFIIANTNIDTINVIDSSTHSSVHPLPSFRLLVALL
jgi:hypothetical protein